MDFFKLIDKANEAYLAAQGIAIPKSIRKDTDRDEEPADQYDETRDWPDDHKLDDPRRGQAKWINR